MEVWGNLGWFRVFLWTRPKTTIEKGMFIIRSIHLFCGGNFQKKKKKKKGKYHAILMQYSSLLTCFLPNGKVLDVYELV